MIHMVKVKVENIVASARLSDSFDLKQIGNKLIGASYDSSQFEGVLYKLLEPKAAFLILRNGKAICTGLKKVETVEDSYKKLAELLTKEEIPATKEEKIPITIKNVVASMDIGQEIDLEAVVNTLESESEYDPETFPGVIYNIKKPRSTALIFSGGKVVFTGPKSMTDLKDAVEVVLESLEKAGAAVI